VDEQEKEMFAKLLQKYEEVVQDKTLRPEERARFEKMRDNLADALTQRPLQPDMSRRVVVLTLIASGLHALFTGSEGTTRR